MYFNAGSESRRLREGDMIFRISNGAKIAAEAVGTYLLRLPSCVRLDLKDCYYVSELVRI